MRQIRLVLLAFTFFIGCSPTDCPRIIRDMRMFPVTDKENSEPSAIPGWYHSEFNTDKLNFALELSITGAGQNCEYFWSNYPIDSTLEISSSKDIVKGTDTLKAGQVLNSLFRIEKVERNHFLNYLISEKANSGMILNDTYYSFSARLQINDGSNYVDSCIVKILSR